MDIKSLVKKKTQKGKKNRKLGRNKAKCERYRAQDRRRKNKAKKIAKHLKKCYNDEVARAALAKVY